MATRTGDATEADRRNAWRALKENRAPAGLARVVPAVLADFWRAERTERRAAPGHEAWSEFLAAATPSTWELPAVAASVRALGGQAEFGRVWRHEWDYQREHARLAALARELAASTADSRLADLVANATYTDESRRYESAPVSQRGGAATARPLLDVISKTHWAAASHDEPAHRLALRRDLWRRVWARLAGHEVFLLTSQAFAALDGAVWVEVSLEPPGEPAPALYAGRVVPAGRPLPGVLFAGALDVGMRRLDRGGFPHDLVCRTAVRSYPAREEVLFATTRELPRTAAGARRAIDAEVRRAREFVFHVRRELIGGARLRVDLLPRHLCAYLLITGWGSLRRVGFRRATRVLFAVRGPIDEDSPEVRATKASHKQAKELIQRWRMIGAP